MNVQFQRAEEHSAAVTAATAPPPRLRPYIPLRRHVYGLLRMRQLGIYFQFEANCRLHGKYGNAESRQCRQPWGGATVERLWGGRPMVRLAAAAVAAAAVLGKGATSSGERGGGWQSVNVKRQVETITINV